MRSALPYIALLAAASIFVTQVSAQAAGDPVTYTTGRVVYTGILDPDLDTVSVLPISTIAVGAVTTTALVAPVTTTALVAPVTTTAVAAATTTAPAAGGAALGGGGGALTTQTGLQTIAGYNPPAATRPPSPTNFSSGVILSASDIPGYTGQENSKGVSSGSVKLGVAKLIVGAVAGAAVFAML